MRRMRKLCVCLMALLFGASSMNVFASEESKAVQGKTIFHQAEYVYTAEITDGTGCITTEDGVEIEIEGEELDDYTLRVVELFAGDEAFVWLQGEMQDIGSLTAAYDVLLEDEKGNLVTPEKEVTVTIRSAQNKTGVRVFHVSSRGTKEELEPERRTWANGDLLTVRGTKLEYYTFLEESEKPGENVESGGQNGSTSLVGEEEGNTGMTTTNSDRQVRTGDTNDVGTVLFIMILCVLVGVCCIRELRPSE